MRPMWAEKLQIWLVLSASQRMRQQDKCSAEAPQSIRRMRKGRNDTLLEMDQQQQHLYAWTDN